jgi:DNA polymerase-4
MLAGPLAIEEAAKPLRVLRELVREVHDRTGITLSVGVGPNRLIAKVCSDLEKPRGFVAMGREEACRRLAEKPLRIIPGIGPKTAERLAAMGFTTIGSLQRVDEETLARSFGARHGRDMLARAHFHGSDVVEAESGPAKSRSNETTFDRDVADPAELEEALARLAGQLAEGLRRKGVRGRTIAIKVRLDDWTTVTRPAAAGPAPRRAGRVLRGRGGRRAAGRPAARASPLTPHRVVRMAPCPSKPRRRAVAAVRSYSRPAT